jgi:hypothetical protein
MEISVLDDSNTIEALRNTRHAWRISDAWRMTYPDNKEYTYRANSTNGYIKSRLDRIYVARNLTPLVYEWEISPSAVPTDHWLVAVKYAPKDAPEIGKGRWTLPLHLTSDNKFLESVTKSGLILQRDLQRLQETPTNREDSNPQLLWKDFKENIKMLAKHAMENKEYKLDSHIKALRKDISNLNNNPQADTNNDIRANEALPSKKLKSLENRRARNQKDKLCVNIANHGETLGGIWSILSKEKKLRDYTR